MHTPSGETPSVRPEQKGKQHSIDNAGLSQPEAIIQNSVAYPILPAEETALIIEFRQTWRGGGSHDLRICPAFVGGGFCGTPSELSAAALVERRATP